MDSDVIIVGAGAAGLAAARSLAGRSLRVIVVEARDRVGGRVFSSTGAFDGTRAELGAEFIHGRADVTKALLREAGMTAIDTDGESWTFDGRTLQRDTDDFLSAAKILIGANTLAQDESVERFLQRFSGDSALQAKIQMARMFVEGFDAADPGIASVRGIAEELESGVDFQSARPVGSYQPMFQFLYDACNAAGVDMRLATVVRTVQWRHGEVMVETVSRNGDTQTIRARAAIITLPASILRQSGQSGQSGTVRFAPNLPAEKREALQKIETGDVIKVALRFRAAFWERIGSGRYRDAGFFRCIGQPFTAYWTQFPQKSTVVSAWAGGPAATTLLREGTDAEKFVEIALRGFEAIFNEPRIVREAFEEGLVHDWSTDPFARGAYSYVAVGGENARATLAAPIERTLFFAGEATATHGHGGTVDGALQTGERAANEVLASFGTSAT